MTTGITANNSIDSIMMTTWTVVFEEKVVRDLAILGVHGSLVFQAWVRIPLLTPCGGLRLLGTEKDSSSQDLYSPKSTDIITERDAVNSRAVRERVSITAPPCSGNASVCRTDCAKHVTHQT